MRSNTSHPIDVMDRARRSKSTEGSKAFAEAPRRRVATVYDAVAGRVKKYRSLRDFEEPLQDDNLHQESTAGPTIYTPDEVLFRRQNAPQRYAEHDVYFSNERNLPNAGQDCLPDSDLLKGLHSYASQYYANTRRKGNSTTLKDDANVRRLMIDERSMDETALLAFGILMEEAGRDVLGKNGGLVFTEGAGLRDGDDTVVEDDEDERQETRSETGGEEMVLDTPAPASKKRRKTSSAPR